MFCDNNYIELDMSIVLEIIKKDLTKIITNINNDLKTYKLNDHSIKKRIYDNTITFDNILLKDYKNNYDYNNIFFEKDKKYMLIDFYNKKYNQFICIIFNKTKIPNEYLLEYYKILKKYYMIMFLFLITVTFLLLLNKLFLNEKLFLNIMILVFLVSFLISPIIITEIIINNKINITLKAKRQKYYNIIGKNMDILANKINIFYKFSNKKNEIYSLKL